jgi:hypothetical protein
MEYNVRSKKKGNIYETCATLADIIDMNQSVIIDIITLSLGDETINSHISISLPWIKKTNIYINFGKNIIICYLGFFTLQINITISA